MASPTAVWRLDRAGREDRADRREQRRSRTHDAGARWKARRSPLWTRRSAAVGQQTRVAARRAEMAREQCGHCLRGSASGFLVEADADAAKRAGRAVRI